MEQVGEHLTAPIDHFLRLLLVGDIDPGGAEGSGFRLASGGQPRRATKFHRPEYPRLHGHLQAELGEEGHLIEESTHGADGVAVQREKIDARQSDRGAGWGETRLEGTGVRPTHQPVHGQGIVTATD